MLYSNFKKECQDYKICIHKISIAIIKAKLMVEVG